MNNPYIISMMTHEDPQAEINNAMIHMLVTIHGFDQNRNMTEFDLDSYTKPYSFSNSNQQEKNFSRLLLRTTLGTFVTSFCTFAMFIARDRLSGEPESLLHGDRWVVVVTAPDGTDKRLDGAIGAEDHPMGNTLLSDYPTVFVEGCKVHAYTPLFVKYGSNMTDMGIQNLDDYKSMTTFSSNMNPMDANPATGREAL